MERLSHRSARRLTAIGRTFGAAAVVLSVLRFASPAARVGESVELVRDGSRVDVRVGGEAFTTYHFETTVAKPYLAPLRSARGTIVTRQFPMVADSPDEDRDEPHQRAMYFAHGDINGFDFWGEAAYPRWSDHSAATFGRTVFRALDELASGPDRGRLRAAFDLVTPAGTIAEETQTYVFSGDVESRTIDCEFVIRAGSSPVTMGDTKEGTFAIRLVKSLASPSGHMVNSRGATGEKAIWGKRAEWVDYDGRVSGEDVGIAIFDHPANPRAPTYWHARGYGLFSANPFGVRRFTGDRRQDGAYTIAAGDALVLRYRVLVHHGDSSQAQIAEAYRRFAAQQ